MTARHRAGRARRGRQAGPPIADTQAGDDTAAPPGRDRRDITRGSPDYVVEVWVSDQLRVQRTGMSLWQPLEVGRQPAPRAEQRPDPEAEAEP